MAKSKNNYSTQEIRTKIVRIMPRSMLEDWIDGERRPYMMSRQQLEYAVLNDWSDDMHQEFLDWLGQDLRTRAE